LPTAILKVPERAINPADSTLLDDFATFPVNSQNEY
jgi:hypothetical protein